MSVLPPSISNRKGVPLLDSNLGSNLTSSSNSKSKSNSKLVTRRYNPRCALAEHVVNQMVELQMNAHAIVKAMGYPRQHAIAASDRLRYVLSSPYMGLDGSYIDPYYDAQGFLDKLAELLHIDSEFYNSELAAINQSLSQDIKR